MTTPDAGWYTDPADARRVRWWDGATWTEHLRSLPAEADAVAVPVVPVPPVYPAQPVIQPQGYTAQQTYRAQQTYPGQQTSPGQPLYSPQPTYPMEPAGRRYADRERAMRRNNPWAYTGVLLVLIGLFFNPFSILSLLGVGFSIAGLARASTADPSVRYNGRVTAIIGLVLGLLATGFFWVNWLRFFAG